MSIEENKALIRSIVEKVWNANDSSLIERYFAPDFIDHRGFIGGREGQVDLIRMVYEIFPDFHIEIEDIIAEDDKVVARLMESGTHKGPLRGIPPSGKHASWEVIIIYRINAGMIQELWSISDMFQALDLIVKA